MEVSDGSILDKNSTHFTVRTKQGLVFHFPKSDRPFDQVYLEKISDLSGNTMHFVRNAQGLSGIYDNAGNTIKVVSRNKQTISISLETDGRFKPLSGYDYDDQGNLEKTYDALRNPHTFYYKNDLITRHTDGNGLSFYYEYDKYEKEGKCTKTYGDQGIHSYSFEYLEKQTIVTKSLGFKSVMHYGEDNLLICVTGHDGSKTRYEYDDVGRVASVTDPARGKTEYSYDRAGTATRITRPDNTSLSIDYDMMGMASRQISHPWSPAIRRPSI